MNAWTCPFPFTVNFHLAKLWQETLSPPKTSLKDPEVTEALHMETPVPSPLLAVSAGGSWELSQDCDSGKLTTGGRASQRIINLWLSSSTWISWYKQVIFWWNSSEVGELPREPTSCDTWDPWQLSLLLLLRSFEPLRPDYNLHEFHTASGLVIYESKRKNNQT